MKRMFAVLCVWLGMALGAGAEGLPDGLYTVAKPIYNNAFVTPRYYELRVVGGRVSVSLVGIIQPDGFLCRTRSLCDRITTPMTFQIAETGGRIAVSEVQINRSIPIDPQSDGTDYGHREYLDSIVGRFEGAKVNPIEGGYELSNQNGFTPLLAVGEGDVDRIRAWVMMLELSVTRFAGCEIQALVPLLANPDASDANRDFVNALDAFVLVNHWQDVKSSRQDFDAPEDNFNEVRELASRAQAYEFLLILPIMFQDQDLSQPEDLAKAYDDFVAEQPRLAPYRDEVMETLLPLAPSAIRLQAAVKKGFESGYDMYGYGCNNPTFGMVPN